MGLLPDDLKDAHYALKHSRLVKLTKRFNPRADIAPVSKRAELDKEVYRLFTRHVSLELASALPSPTINVELDAKLGFYQMNPHDTEVLGDAVSKMQQALMKMRQSRGHGAQGEMMVGQSELMSAVMQAHKSKVDLTIRLMTQELDADPNCQVILFGVYRESLFHVAEGLSRYGVGILNGETKMQDRAHIQAKFHAGSIRVLVCNVQVGGAGLNLQDKVGNRLRITFLWPSYLGDSMYQAMYRTYRVGAKSRVKVRFILSEKHPEQCLLDNWSTKTKVWKDLLTRQVGEGQLFLADLPRVVESPEEARLGIRV
jgi:hypothetical protein